MSLLEEKLAKISKENQDTKLAPIRAEIKDLENIKYQIELIKGSLELMSDEEIGKGMTEHSTDIKADVKNQYTALDNLFEKNKEGLKAINIENIDQLIENQDFSKEDEIINYKKTKNQEALLNMADDVLLQKLQKLGIVMDVEDFSYNSAKRALIEKLKSIDQKLLQEELKTPEGKEKVINKLMEELESQIPPLHFSKDRKTNADILNLGRNVEISVGKEKVKFEFSGKYGYLIGTYKSTKDKIDEVNQIRELENTYNPNLIKEAFLKLYENKIDNAFEDFDKKEIEQENLKKKLMKFIEISIQAEMKFRELDNVINDTNFCSDISSVSSKISRIEENKEIAIDLMTELAKIESELPEEKVILNGASIEVPSIIKEREQLEKNSEEKEVELKTQEEIIRKHEIKKPSYWWIDKWSAKLEKLKKDKNNLEKEIWKMKEDRLNLYYKAYPYIKVKEYSDIEKLVKNQEQVEGNPKEIFENLKIKLSEVINQRVPENIIKLYHEYEEFKKQAKSYTK